MGGEDGEKMGGGGGLHFVKWVFMWFLYVSIVRSYVDIKKIKKIYMNP